MLNTGKLAGKTLFITGASRGIGKAIALKAAADGANIVIAAKTGEANPKLPGTIFSAAEEIEKAGGKCLPCMVDVREEQQVQDAVEQAIRKFGGIDIVVNNASAISLTGTLDTPMKRYDLMHQINTRGTFLVSQKCIPYLKQSKNGHILNISPPLNMKPIWFKNHVGYTMAKYGMSMCVLGMADELRSFNIAVNALWPRTAIWTAAMKMLGGGDEIAKSCRKEAIVADAAYVIMTKDSRSFTGNFCIDEEVLKDVGISDFSKYAVQPGHPLMPDFFLDEASPEELQAHTRRAAKETVGKTKEPKVSQTAAGGAKTAAGGAGGAKTGGAVGQVFDQLRKALNRQLIEKMQATYNFSLTGSESGDWHLDLKSGAGAAASGQLPNSDVKMTMDSADFVKMFKGQMKPTAAFMTGKLKIEGNLQKAMKLEKLMGEMKSKL